MKKMRMILLALALMGNSCLAATDSAAATTQEKGNEIQWLSNYDEAVKAAEAQDLPILLFFTGSDWCTWCKRLEQEALDTAEFAAKTNGKFVFVMLDFPMHQQMEPRLASQNQQLKKKFSVTGFPSVVIVDSKGNRIGTTGYRQGGATRFAEHLLAMVDSYQKHRTNLQDLSSNQDMSPKDLKQLYLEARELGETKEAAAILEKGLKDDKDHFFLLEKYRNTLESGDMYSKDALRLRDRLLATISDPSKANHDIAIVEFEVLQDRMKRDKLSPAAVVTPLVQYLEKFGAQDPEVWRVHMAIAQVYTEAGQPQEALRHALEAQLSAPAKVKPDIDNAVEFIKNQAKG